MLADRFGFNSPIYEDEFLGKVYSYQLSLADLLIDTDDNKLSVCKSIDFTKLPMPISDKSCKEEVEAVIKSLFKALSNKISSKINGDKFTTFLLKSEAYQKSNHIFFQSDKGIFFTLDVFTEKWDSLLCLSSLVIIGEK